MNTLEVPGPSSGRSTFIFRFLCIGFCLTGPLLFHSVSAQNLTSQPVARLITVTGPSDVTVYSRPRRVNVASHGSESIVAGATNSPSLDEATESERRAFEVTNDLRVKNGLATLAWDRDLSRMARFHSESMARNGFFSHETPDRLRLRERARAVGIQRFKVLGENIAYNQGFDDPGAFTVQRWMMSSAHRANILSTEFRSSGIGSFIAADGTFYLTQVFISR